MQKEKIEIEEKNIEIFRDTMDCIKYQVIDMVSPSRCVIKEHHHVSGFVRGGITVEEGNIIDRALDLFATGKWIAVLSFADFTRPGGLVAQGSSSLEADLCRCSSMYPSLSEEPLYEEHKRILNDCGYAFNDDIIYLRNVLLFKNSKYEMAGNANYLDIISCSAPDMTRAKLTEKELFTIMQRRWSNILAAADHRGVGILILGAWGCGISGCDPEIVACAFKAAAAKTMFEGKVVFMVPPASQNYKIFKYVLC